MSECSVRHVCSTLAVIATSQSVGRVTEHSPPFIHFILFHYHLVSCHSCQWPLSIAQDNIKNTHTHLHEPLLTIEKRGILSFLSFGAIVPYSFLHSCLSILISTDTHANIQIHRFPSIHCQSGSHTNRANTVPIGHLHYASLIIDLSC